MNLVIIFVWLAFMFGVAFFFLLSAGGGLLKTRLKSKMLFWKGKGKHIQFFDKSGKSRFYYEIPDKEGCITIDGEKYKLSETNHSLADRTNGKGTIHVIDGEPLYIIVQGSPSNVLVKQRDYDLDISRMTKIIKDIHTLVIAKDEVGALKYANGLINASFKLSSSYKYLVPARKIAKELLLITPNYNDNGISRTRTGLQMLKLFEIGFSKLQRVLVSKNRTLINFTEFFSVINLSNMFNDGFAEAGRIRSIEQERIKKSQSKIAKVGIGIAVVVVGLLVFLLIKQGESIDELSIQMTAISKNMIEIKDSTSGIVNADLNVTGNPVLVNNGTQG